MKNAKSSSGWSVRTVMLALFVGMALLGAAGIVGFLHIRGDNLRLARIKAEAEVAQARAENERLKAEAQAKRSRARQQVELALVGVRGTTNQLGESLDGLRRLVADTASLKTNELGRRLAVFPELVVQARHLIEADLGSLPSQSEIVVRLENSRRTELDLVSKLGGTYLPDADFVASGQAARTWAEDTRNRVARTRATLEALTREAHVKVLLDQQPGASLGEAIGGLADREALQRQTQSATALAEAKALAAKKEDEILKDSVSLEAKAKAEELALRRKELVAKLEREQRESQATEQVLHTESDLAVQTKADEARTMVLKKKAADSRIEGILAPFTTPGYYTAYGKLSFDKKPISFTELKNSGALEPTNAGIQAMVNLAYTSRDKVRPRWKFTQRNAKSWLHVAADMERVKEAQALLIELGPVLVQMGQLEP